MKIEINLDIEAIVREALRNNTSTDSVVVTTTSNKRPHKSLPNVNWEFGPIPGRRRNTAEIAMHDLELKYGRLLTPEEKGETKAFIQADEDTELKAKEDTLTKIRIDGMVTEGLAAASKDLAEEGKDPGGPQDLLPEGYPINPLEDALEDNLNRDLGEKEATIPKTEELKTNSLFS